MEAHHPIEADIAQVMHCPLISVAHRTYRVPKLENVVLVRRIGEGKPERRDRGTVIHNLQMLLASIALMKSDPERYHRSDP